MNGKQFNLGKTEVGILHILKEKSKEETEVSRAVLSQGLAVSTHIVSTAIKRLSQKGLISRNSKTLSLTETGKHIEKLL